MAKYRKKPVVIEAIEWGDNRNCPEQKTEWFLTALASGTLFWRNGQLAIKTLEGEMTVQIGDYIIQGVKGELYPCKPDIFLATYDQVEG